jgi:hypothetical protein
LMAFSARCSFSRYAAIWTLFAPMTLFSAR